MSNPAIEHAIREHAKQLKKVDDAIMMESGGVSHAIDTLRKALDQVEASLQARHYEKASQLGYCEVASEFIFLQRTLGGLQDAVSQSQGFVSEMALLSGNGVYEETWPYVKAHMSCMKPYKKPTAEEKAQYKVKFEALMKRLNKHSANHRES